MNTRERVHGAQTSAPCSRATLIGGLAVLASVLTACDVDPARSRDGAIDASSSDATVEDASVEDASVDATDAGPGCRSTRATSTRTESGLAVTHHDGQSFISWPDREEGEAGASIRYRVFRSDAPIRDDAALADAELIADGVLNHSGQLFGEAFRPEHRLDPSRPMAVIEEGGEPLPAWSGLWIATARTNACAYYAVLATDRAGTPLERIEPGINATETPIAERVAPRRPIKVYDSNEREGPSVSRTNITGTSGLPLMVQLHASEAQGGGAGQYGDYLIYFGDETMGYQDGTPGVASIEERRGDWPYLLLRNRDAIVSPDGSRAIETQWFGYVAQPRTGEGRFAYPYTERRLLFMIHWAIEAYQVDPNRVYAIGGSMGAWGSVLFGFRRPELFAAVYPDRPRFRQRTLSSVVGPISEEDRVPSGEPWREHHDTVPFVRSHPGDLPFLAWNCGRRDGFATWQEQVDMVDALTAMRHGFAFAWNDGDHSSGSRSRLPVRMWYPQSRFARDASYPALTHSSIDDDPGDGDPGDGDLEGGINLGFDWIVVEDSEGRWILELSNALVTGAMTVDVTPRRLQRFSPRAGETYAYTISRDGVELSSGAVVADPNGLVTLEAVPLVEGQATRISIQR